MLYILLSYTLKPLTLKLLYLLLLVPVLMAAVAYFVMKRCKAAVAKHFAETDRKIEQRMKEIAEEKALDDDFGEEWHVHGSNS